MNNYEACKQLHKSLDLKQQPQEQPQEQKLLKVKTVRNIALVPVAQAAPVPAPLPERQQKYLGLIIEKDEEQLVEVRTDSEFETEEFVYQQAPIDPVKRVYKPVREKYITIVKNSRKLYLNAFEKRGRRDLMKTQRVLRKIGR